MNSISPALDQEIVRQRARDITREARTTRVLSPHRHRFGLGRRTVSGRLGE